MTKTGRRGLVATLAVLAALNLIFIVLLLRPGDSSVVTATAAPAPATTGGGDVSSAPPAAGEPARSVRPGTRATPAVPATAPSSWVPEGSTRLLVAARQGVAVRATPGACPDGSAQLQRSTDGGRTWTTLSPPAPGLLNVDLGRRGALTVLTGTESCRGESFESFDRGASWRSSGPADWYLPPGAERRVRTPYGETPAPCRTLQLDPIDGGAAAMLCASGAVFVSGDRGESWGRRQLVEDAVAVDFLDPLTGWILAPHPACGTGMRVLRTTDGGLHWLGRGCVDVPRNVPLGFAFADESDGLLVAGAETHRTVDGGRTWQRIS